MKETVNEESGDTTTLPQSTPLPLVDPPGGLESSTEYFTARDSAHRPPESTVSLIQKFNQHKLETEFYDGYVVHKECEWKPLCSSRSWETSTWKQKKKVGSGGFGDIWLQEKEEGGEGGRGERQLRAVKILPRDSLPDAGRSQELLALVKLGGYNHLFVKFLGWYEDAYYTFLAMEYIEYGDLGNYIKGSWAKTEAKEITRQVLEGLEVLHGKGICHRDLKPQNILMASLDPVWIKIADFGTSKWVNKTLARTVIGTPFYMAPEVLGAVPREFKKGFIPHALDIWSLGSLVHEILTSETPFIEPLCDLGTDSESGLQAGLPSECGIDFVSLCEYCHGRIGFPTDALQRSQLGEEEITFIKSLLMANPNDRPTATHALHNPWLTGYTYTSDYVKKLKDEFSCLGADLDLGGKENILTRQVGKEDITLFLASSAKARVSSLLMEAVAKGCNLVISRLLESPNCDLESIDSLTRGKLFQLAADAMQLDIIELLLQYQADIGACIGDQTVLQWAVEAGNVDMVNLFLENTAGSDVRANKGHYGALLLAIKLGHVNMVKVFLNKIVDINASNGNSQTALEAAAGGGHIDIVKLLLDNKADVNARGSGHTALEAAAGGGHIDIVKFLLDNKADVNARGSGHTALEAAAGGGHIDIVKLLLDNKADVNAEVGYGGRTALQAAAEGGHIGIVNLLLDNKADVNAEAAKESGRTALQAAAEGGHIGVVNLLLDNKADVNAEAAKESGRTALQAVAEGGHIGIVNLLLDNKADVNAEAGSDGRTALQAAAGGGHTDIVKLLLDNKADVNAKAGYGGRTALQAAAEGGHIGIVKLLLDKADVNARGSGRTALQAAVKDGHIDIVKLLLDNKADVNAEAAKESGRTALQAAAEGGHIGIVKGVEIDCPADEHHSHNHKTVLHFAAFQGNEPIVKLLLEKGANIDQQDENGITALHLATLQGHESVVRLLLENGADVTIKDKAGLSIISKALKSYNHYQAQRNPNVFRLLFDHKADINDRDYEGATALHYAVKLGDIKILGALLDLGADPYIKSKDGETPLDWALIQTFPLPNSHDHQEALERRYQVVRFLQERGLVRCLGGKYYDERRPVGRREYWKLACGSGIKNQLKSVVKTLTSIGCPASTLGRYYRQEKINLGRALTGIS